MEHYINSDGSHGLSYRMRFNGRLIIVEADTEQAARKAMAREINRAVFEEADHA